MHLTSRIRLWRQHGAQGGQSLLGLCRRLLGLGRNSMALLGLGVAAALLFALTRDDLRHELELQALGWLQQRQEARDPSDPIAELAEPSAIERATAADPKGLPRSQAAVAQWLSKRYRVAPEPVSRLVQEAWSVGRKVGIEPTLVLAVMAVESSFNPFAQSPVGAQGLMQVMTHIHDDKYQPFGGVRAAFDPVTNLRVGVQVLKECIARAGGLEAGLRSYVGAALSGQDGGYVAKVLAEQGFLQRVAGGKSISPYAPLPVYRAPAPEATLAVPAAPSGSAPAAVEERVALLR